MTKQSAKQSESTRRTLFGIPVVMADDMPEAGIVIAAPPVERHTITLTDMGDGTFEARVKREKRG